jgi:hypothetical protein
MDSGIPLRSSRNDGNGNFMRILAMPQMSAAFVCLWLRAC